MNFKVLIFQTRLLIIALDREQEASDYRTRKKSRKKGGEESTILYNQNKSEITD